MAENSAQKISRFKYAAISAFGFGIGGLLWGLEAYHGTVGSDEVFTNPFSYVLGAVAMAICGGAAFAYLKKGGMREAAKLIGLGLVGWLAAFFVPGVWAYQLYLGGGMMISALLSPVGDTSLADYFIRNIGLDPSLIVGVFILEFLISGIIIGAVYAFILKATIIKTALWAGFGFAIASLIGPILGNLIGGLFDSLLISYLVTFLVIGKVFGFAVGRSL